jgi:putative nucleotidyltransferase with HDIG domain
MNEGCPAKPPVENCFEHISTFSRAQFISLFNQAWWEEPESIEKMIAWDPMLTASILQHANRSCEAGELRYTHMSQVLANKGVGEVMRLIEGLLLKNMATPSPLHQELEAKILRHTMASTLAVQRFAEKQQLSLDNRDYTAALLHDIGRFAILCDHGAETVEHIEHCRQAHRLTWQAAEYQILATDHIVLGAGLVRDLQLPEIFREIILKHHAPDPGDNTLVKFVQWGDWVSECIENQWSYAACVNFEPSRSLARAFSPEAYADIRGQLRSHLEGVSAVETAE